jgi:hypothetical protein
MSNHQCQGDPTLGPGGTAEFTRTRTRTLAARSNRQTMIGGGLSLQTLSSEERLIRAPFLTVLDALTILKQFLRTSKHLSLSTPAHACTKVRAMFHKGQKGRAGHSVRMALHVARTRRASMALHDRAGCAWHCMSRGSCSSTDMSQGRTWSAPAAQQRTLGTSASHG